MFQNYVLSSLKELLPGQYVGTSNVLMAMQQGSNNPIGTNAHELPMVFANITEDDSDEAIRQSQYKVVEEWSKFYPGLAILLPDTYGTTQFLAGAPDWVAKKYLGSRLDSKDPQIATDEFIVWWEKRDVDPMTKTLIPSDGLTAAKMVELFNHNSGRVGRYTFGFGTHNTNNCSGLWPMKNDPGFGQISMVVKVTEAAGMPAVKLSDNPSKALGGERAERFKRIFGSAGFDERPVSV